MRDMSMPPPALPTSCFDHGLRVLSSATREASRKTKLPSLTLWHFITLQSAVHILLFGRYETSSVFGGSHSILNTREGKAPICQKKDTLLDLEMS